MMKSILPQSFYARNTVTIARDLLGKQLICHIDGIIREGIIVEAEAYCSDNDPASHAFSGKTKRNTAMFGPAGHAYIYFIYGNHYCFNIVAKEDAVNAGAVLIRAIEPIIGIEHMQKARGNHQTNINLTNGPGKLTQAFNINLSHNNCNLTKKEKLWIVEDHNTESMVTVCTPRIGIKSATDYIWRFYIKDNPWVSR